MNSSPTDTWAELFAVDTPEGRKTTVDLRLVRRRGQPFLLLPEHAGCAAKALSLYPAQTVKARAAKLLLALALRAGATPRFEKTSTPISLDDDFVRFLMESASPSAETLPPFAILPGNPNTEGRRFVILLFDTDNDPVAVVKAGITAAARRLIAHETTFLETVPPQTEGVPKLRGKFGSARLDAFATDFTAGNSPGLHDLAPLATLLSSWITVGRTMAMSEFGAWHRLLHAATAGAPLSKPVLSLGAMRFHATLTHGDCAPWNVKTARGKWTLLDWERGELAGIPTWDWLHFVVQSAVLVRREKTSALLARLERLFSSEEFSNYTQRAGMAGNERALALAYLSYCTRVLRQTEGLKQVASLEAAAAHRWFSGAA